MGTDNIDLLFNPNLSGYEVVPSTGWTLIGQARDSQTSSGLFWGTPFDQGGYWKTTYKNTPASFYVWCIVRRDSNNGASDNGGCGVFVRLTDGNYYYVHTTGRNTGSYRFASQKQTTRPSVSDSAGTTAPSDFETNGLFSCFGMHFKTNGKVDIVHYTGSPNSWASPDGSSADGDIQSEADWFVMHSEPMDWSGAKISEVGMMNNYSDSPTSTSGRMYRIYVEADLPTHTDPTDLELGTAKIISHTALHAPAGQGYGRILISDPRLANYATILGNVKNLVSIRDITYGNPFVLGEVDSLSIIDKDTVSLSISNNAIKTRKQKCNHNQVIYSNFMKYVRDDAILDHVDAIPTGLTGHAVSMEKKNLKAMTIYPISLVEDHSPVSGDINSLYQEGEMLDYGSDKDYSNDYTQFTFHLYITSKNDITKLKLNLKYKIRAENNGYYINPLWEVFQNGAWWTLYEVDEEAEGGGYVPIDISHLDLLPMDMFTITNLLETVDSLNTSGYVEYSLKIRFFSGQRNVLDNDFHVYIFDIIQLVVETDNVEQPVTIGQGLIDAASDADIIVFDNVTPTRNIEKFPASEGFGDGDQYYVTKWLDDIMIDIFNNADTLFSYSQNITDIEDHVIFTDDLTMEYIYNVLETVKNTLNAPWWLNAENNDILQQSIDNLLATGLTLTNVDFVGGLAGISYVVDGKNIRTHATVIGKNDTVTSVIDEEYTPEGGNEEEIVVRPNISNPTALNKELLSLIKKHTNANVALSGTINYSSLLQNYSSISLYKTIIVTLDDGDGNEIISKTLTITKLELNNSKATGYKDHVTIWLEVLIE